MHTSLAPRFLLRLRPSLPVTTAAFGGILLAVCTAVVVFAVAALALATPALVFAGQADAQGGSQVRINEILASNDSFIADEYGEFVDWIELHNPGDAAVDLSDWSLTDDATSPRKWTFPSGTTLGSGEYLIVYASKKDPLPGSGNLHASFSLSASGEFVGLFDSGGNRVDAFAPEYPAQTTDISYGVRADGSLGFFAEPSPNAPNSGPGVTAEVTFSVAHGFYDSAFDLALASASDGATIRYTLDGSDPTLANGSTFGAQLRIDATAIVRARAIVAGQPASAITTQTYVFLDDVIDQDSSPPGWPSGDINGQVLDFGMDPDVVEGNEAAVRNSLRSIPTMSLVTDIDNLFDPDTGIYVNAIEDGREWERPASLELIDPNDPDAGFETNAGVRVRGGFSRIDENPKHAFRIFFRSEYGDAKLDYPLFGDEGAATYEKIDLRTSQNYSWAWYGDGQNTLVRDLWSRDTQRDMGQPHSRSNYYHLYVNGQYFGIFQTQERVSKEYAESYFGGDKDDYDVVKSDRDLRYETTAADGDLGAWQSMWGLVSDEFVSNAEYVSLESRVDLENLADYYLLHFFSGDFDGAPSWFVEREQDGPYNRANNWQAIRDRNGGKWQFFDHDSEHALCIRDGGPDDGVEVDNTTPWPSGDDNAVWNEDFFNPAWLHQALLTNDNYVQLFRDRVQLHLLTPGAALSAEANRARLDARLSEVDDAILAQSARWGDGTGGSALGVQDWEDEVGFVRNTCLVERQTILRTQLAADDLMPTLDPPEIPQVLAAIPYGASVAIANPNGAGNVVYTTDGSDPRGLNGQRVPSSSIGSNVAITDYVTITARVQSDDGWSAPATAVFELASIPTQPAIILNEYNAVAGDQLLNNGAVDPAFGQIPGNGGDWFELVVLEDGLDLRGWQFEIIDGETRSATRDVLELTTSAVLRSIPAGTIVTVSEDHPDDITVRPAAGDWSMNLRANNADDGLFFTDESQENFDTNADDWQLIIRDATGAVRALKTGEGAGALTGVGPRDVGKLEATPSVAITPNSNYDDGTTSTFGMPNRWDDERQDLSGLRGFSAPSVDIEQSCFVENGRFDVTLSNSGTLESSFVVTLGSLPPRSVTVGPGGSEVVTFTGRIDGTYTLSVAADGLTLVSQSYDVACDPEVRLAVSCLQQNGRVDAFIINRGIAAADYRVSFGPLVRNRTIESADDARVTVTGRRDGSLPVTVDRNGIEIYTEDVLVDCDPPGPEVAVTVSCLLGNGWIQVSLDNNGNSSRDYEVLVGPLPGRLTTLAPKETTRVSVTGRADGDYPVIVRRDGIEIFSSNEQVGCDLVPGSEVTIASGCLAGFGRIDVTLYNNGSSTATYDLAVGALTRSRTVDAGKVSKVTITGRPDGPLRVTVTKGGSRIFTSLPNIACGEPG